MKTAHILATAFVTLSSLSVFALKSAASAPQDSAQAGGSASAAAEMRPVKGELVNKLDAKSARAGDQVVVKTTESVRTASGIEIPKGSRLIGTVTEVQAHGSDSADSHVALRFDHAELKGGQSVPIHSEIRSLAPPVSPIADSSMDSANSMGSMGGGSMGAGGGPMGNTRGGMAGGGPAGGALGGVGSTAGSAGGIANTTARTPGTLNSAADDAAPSAGGLAGRTSDAGTMVNAGAAGSGVAHATGVSGVMLSGRAGAASSGILSASKKNVHLDSGTQMVLAISADQR